MNFNYSYEYEGDFSQFENRKFERGIAEKTM